MATTQVNLDNNAEEMIFHIKKKFGVNKPQAINLLINGISNIFDTEPDRIYNEIKNLNK